MKKNNTKFVFETTSALGNTVIMTQERFEEHIIEHHPEMEGHESDIQETVEIPNVVCEAKRHPEKRKHFIRKTHEKEISQYNNVIVEYDENEIGHVTTSYYSEDLERGGSYVYIKFENKI